MATDTARDGQTPHTAAVIALAVHGRMVLSVVVAQTARLGLHEVEVEEVRRHLEATFGTDALHAAERRVRRRSRWRGGPPRPSPLCVYILAKRSFEIAARFADRLGGVGIEPEHLLYGVRHDARDPLGTELSRRSRKELAVLGWLDRGPSQPAATVA
jgi:hypothetical protein